MWKAKVVHSDPSKPPALIAEDEELWLLLTQVYSYIQKNVSEHWDGDEVIIYMEV